MSPGIASRSPTSSSHAPILQFVPLCLPLEQDLNQNLPKLGPYGAVEQEVEAGVDHGEHHGHVGKEVDIGPGGLAKHVDHVGDKLQGVAGQERESRGHNDHGHPSHRGETSTVVDPAPSAGRSGDRHVRASTGTVVWLARCRR